MDATRGRGCSTRGVFTSGRGDGSGGARGRGSCGERGRGRGFGSVGPQWTGANANIALNKRISAAGWHGAAAILDVLAAEPADSLNIVNCCTALNRLSKLIDSPPERANLQTHAVFQGLLARLAHLLPAADARATSIAAHACASLGVGHTQTLAALGVAVRAHSSEFDRQGVAMVLWSLAKLPRSGRGDAPLLELSRSACAHAEHFTAQEVANIMWALPQLGVGAQHEQRLIERLTLAARHNIADFTTQGLAMLASGLSSLGCFSDLLFKLISTETGRQTDNCNVQDAGQILAAFAKMKISDPELFKVLYSRASSADWEKEGNESVTTFLWAMGSLGTCNSEERPLLKKILTRLAQLTPAMRPRHMVLALTGLGKLFAARTQSGKPLLKLSEYKKVTVGLVERMLEFVDDLDGQDLALSAWSVAALVPVGTIQGEGPDACTEFVRRICARAAEPSVLAGLTWWSCAHLEYALSRCTPPSKESEPFLAALSTRVLSETKRLHEDSDANSNAPEVALVTMAPWSKRATISSSKRAKMSSFALLIGASHGGALWTALRDAGVAATTWNRFASAESESKAWPDTPTEKYTLCFLRYPGSKDSLDYALAAAASLLPKKSHIWVYGSAREGVLSAVSAVAPFFKHKSTLSHGEVRVISASRLWNSVPKKGMEAWLQDQSVDLGAGLRSWIVAPGLFAGGTVDVMTALLLDRLTPSVPVGAQRILDFGCGSGVLAAGLQARREDVEVTLLDADAVAIEVAKRNMPNARVILGDGRLALLSLAENGERFQIVASNPPVHRGRSDDWRVLQDLIAGASAVLSHGGELWMVSQEHIPVGRLIANTPLIEADPQSVPRSRYAWSVELEFCDGRFAVWRARWTKRVRLSEGRAETTKKRKRLDA